MATQVSFEGKRELRWLMVGQCLVTYMEAEVELADGLWDEWMQAIRRPTTAAVMLCSWGPTQPSHQQWRMVTRLMRELELPVAVVTDARHNLALAKAASWLGTNIESHRWSDLAAAVLFVGLGEQAISAHAKIVALRDRFGSVTGSAESYDGARAKSAVSARPARSAMASRSSSNMIMTASSEVVFEHSHEIQARLAQVQARFQAQSGASVAASGSGD